MDHQGKCGHTAVEACLVRRKEERGGLAACAELAGVNGEEDRRRAARLKHGPKRAFPDPLGNRPIPPRLGCVAHLALQANPSRYRIDDVPFISPVMGWGLQAPRLRLSRSRMVSMHKELFRPCRRLWDAGSSWSSPCPSSSYLFVHDGNRVARLG